MEPTSSSFIDDIDCSNFYDHIEDLLLDFPEDQNNNNNKETANAFGGAANNSCDKFPGLWHDDDIIPDSVFIGKGSPDLAAELSVPYEDIVQLEWLSTFVEDSFSGGNSMTLDKDQFPVAKEVMTTPINQFCSASPISVLESSSSSSTSSTSSCSGGGGGGKTLPSCPELAPIKGGRGRARSKRPRPPTFNPGSTIQLISPAQSFVDAPQTFVPHHVSEGDNFIQSRPMTKAPPTTTCTSGQKKKRKTKASSPLGVTETHTNQYKETNADAAEASQAGIRKCLHCEITKTPQWRAGPMGPKTLCNACGVRFKSGRLFPEYRPAASPTFVPSIHSNSHKKVIEMRTSCLEVPAATTTISTKVASSSSDAQPEFIPNKDAMVKYM